MDCERVEMYASDYSDCFDYNEWNEGKLEKLEELDWFVIWTKTE